MMAAEIIEIKSVSLSPNPVQTGGKAVMQKRFLNGMD